MASTKNSSLDLTGVTTDSTVEQLDRSRTLMDEAIERLTNERYPLGARDREVRFISGLTRDIDRLVKQYWQLALKESEHIGRIVGYDDGNA